ncbi:MAG TPA: uracil-DNA glycosylase [Coprothermobacter proteolyticus]|nr:uracil-DNA glycosylase [Coprothermobacter proteolyticus]HOL52719.1 uracil-DNA glycosylase [Coprothermobacter proteolyticus]HOP45728.1 uracil-DNA glycosylase [Coprothermobacter proteolyticus]
MNQELWKELEQFALNCKACELCKTRRNVVFGSGDPNSRLWLVGEAPGSNEDEQGLPFVGQAGAILDTFLEKNGFKRHSLFITNVIKCRPPNNADPTEDQKSKCFPILAAQLAIGKPKYILALGRHAAEAFVPKPFRSIKEIRGQVVLSGETKVVVTYHPAAVLRNPRLGEIVEHDIQMMSRLIAGE